MKTQQQTSFFKFILSELKPKGKIITPFNVISFITIITACYILFIRFTLGLGSVSHASQHNPWGLWINFNVITGVAFAGGAYVLTFMVYILGMEKYRPIIRPAVLFSLLSYVFYAGALLLDLGRPWKVINPIIGNSFGISAILFLVAWHFLLYMGSLFIEFLPTISEWGGLKRLRKIAASASLGVVIFGIVLSTLHQSGLGALFLIAKPKIHPLWYSEFIPIMFFISSIFSGLSVVIVLETINQRVFRKNMSVFHRVTHSDIMTGLARISSTALFLYFFVSVLVFIHDKNYAYLNTSWGYWYLVEIIGFVLLPCIIFMLAYKQNKLLLVRLAAVMTMIGIVLNRMNISTIAFRWYENHIHYPTWQEVVVSAAIIFIQLLIFRWVARRMPVYTDPPSWAHMVMKNKSINSTNKKREQWKVLAK